MKSIIFLMSFFLVSCSATEASSSWIANLLNVKNANFVADNSGVITMDGFTYTIAEVRSPFSAIYNVFLGEFANRETAPFGFVRFDINSRALNDTLVQNPLSISEVATTIADAISAPALTGVQITSVPRSVIDARFLRTLANLSYRAFMTNGPSAGSEFNVINDTGNSEYSYLVGISSTDGRDLFFQDVALRKLGIPLVFDGYFREAQWQFVEALNDTQAIYQRVEIEKFDPGDAEIFTNPDDPDYLFPQRAADPAVLEDIFIGVEKRSDSLYFYYPSATTFYTTSTAVSFSSGLPVKVGRPLTQADVDSF
ncbi:MAG: hypothetical protein ACRCY4_02715 [Brevinema sp.]